MPFRPIQPQASSTGPTPGFRPITPAPAAPAAAPGIIHRIKTGVAEKGQQRAETIVAATDAFAAGKQGTLRSLFQIGGQLVGGAVDPVVEAAKAATPTIVKKGLTTLLTPVSAVMQATADKVSDIPAVQRLADSDQGEAVERDVQAFQEFLNLVPLPGAGRVAGKAGTIALDKTAGTVKAVAEAPTAPFRKSFLPGVAKAFKDEGIVPPVSAITGSEFVRGAENVAAKSAFGRPILDTVRTAEKRIDEKTTEIINRITPVKTMSDENLGKTIQEGLREYEIRFKETEEKVYATFTKKYGKSDGVPLTTRDVLDRIVTQQGMDFFKGVDPRFAGMLDTITGETKDIAKLRKELADSGLPPEVVLKEIQAQRQPPKLTFEELKATRTSVGEQLARDPDNSALKQLYGALSADMQRVVETIDPKNGGAALQKLNAQYKAGRDKIESRLASSIEQSNPERIAQNIVTRNSADALKVLKEMVGPARFSEISKTFLRQQFESAVTRGKFDVAKLKTNLAQFDQATINQVLDAPQLDELNQAVAGLERLQALTDALKPGKRFSEGSQTAYLQVIQNMGYRGAAFLTALFTGQIGLAAGLLFTTGVEASYAKLFTTDAGRKFLTEGLFSKRDASVGDYLQPKGKLGGLFRAPGDIAPAKRAKLPQKKAGADFFLRLQGQEDKIRGQDDGEPPRIGR